MGAADRPGGGAAASGERDVAKDEEVRRLRQEMHTLAERLRQLEMG